MAEIVGIASGIFTAAQALGVFAHQIQRWRDLSERLFDLKQGLTLCMHVYERWQHKWEVNQSRPNVYLRALFGQEGCDEIRLALSSIDRISKSLQHDVDRIIGRPLRFRRGRNTREKLIDPRLVDQCLEDIRRNTNWKRKFVLSVWRRAESLEKSLDRFKEHLKILEGHTDYYLDREHPDMYSEIKLLPGRKFVLRLENNVKDKISNTLAAQKDAQLLHQASHSNNKIHIGLSVPRIYPKDFAFLLPLDGQTHEFVVKPVRIRANKPVPRQLASAVSQLSDPYNPDPCVVMPSHSTDGFQLSIPPVPLLTALEFKAPLSNTFSFQQNPHLVSQPIYTQDQNALATGIAQSTQRLLGSRWLSFLDTQNIRWRRTTDGQWISMLTAIPGDASTSRTLETCHAAFLSRRREPRDVARHIQIFRIGLVLTELCLRTRIAYISFNPRTFSMAIHIPDENGIVRERTTMQISAEVDLRCNPYLGDMVFFCLGALQESSGTGDDVTGGYLSTVVKSAGQLEVLVNAPWRKAGSPRGSPRSAVYGR